MNVVKIIFHKLSKKLAYKFTKKSVKMSFFDRILKHLFGLKYSTLGCLLTHHIKIYPQFTECDKNFHVKYIHISKLQTDTE
ncbi:hypothetical protein T05_14202 [Trichinella murrelli]|uniref:Uncharacterized protein n=1 Tax=Trichinella murrelli TaxID=144512 RepID=A0A0V0TJU5_9BILA|nr:hypothetical protein T05_14202 [Trichinella murrelli]